MRRQSSQRWNPEGSLVTFTSPQDFCTPSPWGTGEVPVFGWEGKVLGEKGDPGVKSPYLREGWWSARGGHIVYRSIALLPSPIGQTNRTCICQECGSSNGGVNPARNLYPIACDASRSVGRDVYRYGRTVRSISTGHHRSARGSAAVSNRRRTFHLKRPLQRIFWSGHFLCRSTHSQKRGEGDET